MDDRYHSEGFGVKEQAGKEKEREARISAHTVDSKQHGGMECQEAYRARNQNGTI